jgi:hypothetical protein
METTPYFLQLLQPLVAVEVRVVMAELVLLEKLVVLVAVVEQVLRAVLLVQEPHLQFKDLMAVLALLLLVLVAVAVLVLLV